jgi:hypothetical protein
LDKAGDVVSKSVGLKWELLALLEKFSPVGGVIPDVHHHLRKMIADIEFIIELRMQAGMFHLCY